MAATGRMPLVAQHRLATCSPSGSFTALGCFPRVDQGLASHGSRRQNLRVGCDFRIGKRASTSVFLSQICRVHSTRSWRSVHDGPWSIIQHEYFSAMPAADPILSTSPDVKPRRIVARFASSSAHDGGARRFSKSSRPDSVSELEDGTSELNSKSFGKKDSEGFLRSEQLRLWVTILGRIILPLVILGVGIFLRTKPSYAVDNITREAIVKTGSRKQILLSAWTGLAAGCLHTLTGPDHLAALAPLCIGRSKVESAQVGALWGCGHDAGQMIFGIVFLVLKDRLHLDVIRTWASRVLGFTLITIGGMGVMEAQEASDLAFEGGGGGGGVGNSSITDGVRIVQRPRALATFTTGVVHGLQPDALLMILPALALPSRLAGVAFLGMFLGGTVLAMGTYTLFISSCSEALQKKVPGITKRLTLGSAVIAIALGSVFILGELLGVSLFGG